MKLRNKLISTMLIAGITMIFYGCGEKKNINSLEKDNIFNS